MTNFKQDHMNNLELIRDARELVDALLSMTAEQSLLDVATDAVPKLREIRKDLEALRLRLDPPKDLPAVKVG